MLDVTKLTMEELDACAFERARRKMRLGEHALHPDRVLLFNVAAEVVMDVNQTTETVFFTRWRTSASNSRVLTAAVEEMQRLIKALKHPPRRKQERAAFYKEVLQEVSRYLHTNGVPVGMKTLLQQHEKYSGILDMAYPEYWTEKMPSYRVFLCGNEQELADKEARAIQDLIDNPVI